MDGVVGGGVFLCFSFFSPALSLSFSFSFSFSFSLSLSLPRSPPHPSLPFTPHLTPSTHPTPPHPTLYRPQAQAVKEIQLLYELKHQNIVSLHGWFMSPKKGKGVGIVVDFAQRGPLRKFVRAADYSYKKGLRVMQDTACGLSYLHSFPNPILHLSINEHSVMVMDDLSGKISDTGEYTRTNRVEDVYSSTTYNGGSGAGGDGSSSGGGGGASGDDTDSGGDATHKRHGITSVAPELLRGEEGTIACDAYSLGMCIYYVSYGKGPFADSQGEGNDASGLDDGTASQAIVDDIAAGKTTISFPDKDGFKWDERVKKLISALCAPTPKDRMRVAEAMDTLSDIRGVVRRLERQ